MRERQKSSQPANQPGRATRIASILAWLKLASNLNWMWRGSIACDAAQLIVQIVSIFNQMNCIRNKNHRHAFYDYLRLLRNQIKKASIDRRLPFKANDSVGHKKCNEFGAFSFNDTSNIFFVPLNSRHHHSWNEPPWVYSFSLLSSAVYSPAANCHHIENLCAAREVWPNSSSAKFKKVHLQYSFEWVHV